MEIIQFCVICKNEYKAIAEEHWEEALCAKCSKVEEIERCSELQTSAYRDSVTREPIFKRRLINEEMWQELKILIDATSKVKSTSEVEDD